MSTPHFLGCLPDHKDLALPIKAKYPFRPTAATASTTWQPATNPSMRVAFDGGMDGAPLVNWPDTQNTNDCVARAVVAALEFLVFQKYHVRVKLSERFPYWDARQKAGLVGDIGCFPIDLLMSAFSVGVPLDIYCPNDAFMVDRRPQDAAYSTEQRVYLEDFDTVGSLLEFQKSICERTPVCTSITIYQNFYTSGPDQNGFMPQPEGMVIGGHFICGVGYDLQKQAVLQRNSWGNDWGLGGYFLHRFEHLVNREYTGNSWRIKGARADFLK